MAGNPIYWHIYRRGGLPIAEVVYETMDVGQEKLIIEDALDMIQIAYELKGLIFSQELKVNKNYNLTVYFSIIFKSEEDFEEFLDAI